MISIYVLQLIDTQVIPIVVFCPASYPRDYQLSPNTSEQDSRRSSVHFPLGYLLTDVHVAMLRQVDTIGAIGAWVLGSELDQSVHISVERTERHRNDHSVTDLQVPTEFTPLPIEL